MERLPASALDSWLNGALDGDAVTSMFGREAWHQTVRGASLLGHAVTRNRLDLVRDALDQAADPNLVDEEGVVPGRMAVLKQRTPIFRLLVALPQLDRLGGATPWEPGQPLPDDENRPPALFFPALAFDLGRYGHPSMAEAWQAGPLPGWDVLTPLERVLERRGHYHRGDLGHALDAALLHNRPPMAAWLMAHTTLTPSPAVLNHGHTFSSMSRDDPPLAPHPALVMVRAMRTILARPTVGRSRTEQGVADRLEGLEQRLVGNKMPWTLGDAVLSLVESLRLHQSLEGTPTDEPTGRGRRRL